MTHAAPTFSSLIDNDHRQKPVEARVRSVPAVACALQIVLAYEWLVSGLNKIGNRHFDSQLMSILQQSPQGSRYGWYASLLHQLVLPYHGLFALLVQVTEPALGAALLLGGTIGLIRPYGRISRYAWCAASIALLGSAVLSLNYFFQGNCPVPWINPGSAFVPGVSVNVLIALVSLVLLVANVRAPHQSPLEATEEGHAGYQRTRLPVRSGSRRRS